MIGLKCSCVLKVINLKSKYMRTGNKTSRQPTLTQNIFNFSVSQCQPLDK